MGAENEINVFDESNNVGTTNVTFGEGVVATQIITGDFDGDGKATLVDAINMLKLALDGDGKTEIHNFYSFKKISLVNVIRAFKKLV